MKREYKVVAVVLLALLGVEACMRVWGSSLSLNMQTIEDIPMARDSVQACPKRILILGNSMTLEGIDYDQLRSNFSELRSPKTFGLQLISLHGAFIGEWNWIVRSWFADCNKMPTDLILNCDPESLAGGSLALRRAGWNTSRSTPLLSMPHCSLRSIDDRCEFLLSRISSLFSRAQDVGTVLKGRFIPHFHDSTEYINLKAVGESDVGLPGPNEGSQYCELSELLALCQLRSTKVHVIWMPTMKGTSASSRLLDLLGRYHVGISKVGVRLEGDDFVDASHLSQKGMEKFTPVYAQLLTELVHAEE